MVDYIGQDDWQYIDGKRVTISIARLIKEKDSLGAPVKPSFETLGQELTGLTAILREMRGTRKILKDRQEIEATHAFYLEEQKTGEVRAKIDASNFVLFGEDVYRILEISGRNNIGRVLTLWCVAQERN